MNELTLPTAAPRAAWRLQPAWCLAALVAAGLWWFTWGQAPVPLSPSLPQASDPSTASDWQQAIQRRGVLRVAVRHYPRPSLPDAPLAPEPDVLDAAYAQWLADALEVALHIAAWDAAADVDLHLQDHGHHANTAQPLAPAGYGESAVQLLVLRQQLPKWQAYAVPAWLQTIANQLPQWLLPSHASNGRASTAVPTVCFGEGAMPATALQARGLQPRPARSAIHAISNFLAGQCDVLAESPDVVDKLLAQNTWRFYSRLGGAWQATTSASSSTVPPPVIDPWLHTMHQRWLRSPARAQALHNRTSTVLLEATMLEDGAICH